MKKTRICAALLSLIMTATAFPAFQASAASAEEPVNLFDTATASVTVEEYEEFFKNLEEFIKQGC